MEIITITSLFKTNIEFNLNLMFNILEPYVGSFITYIEYSPYMDGSNMLLESNEMGCLQKRKVRNNKRFRNQMIVKIMDEKSLKIFKNGTIHIIGYKSIIDIYKVLEEFLVKIKPLIETTEFDNLFKKKIEICSISSIYKLIPIQYTEKEELATFIEDTLKTPTFCTKNVIQVFLYFNESNDTSKMCCECKFNLTCGLSKRLGKGNGECILITLTIFKTGLIRINGITSSKCFKRIEQYISTKLKHLIINYSQYKSKLVADR